MNRIAAPIRADDRGSTVANLQDGLALLLERAHISSDDSQREGWLLGLRHEREERQYGELTRQIVQQIQEEQGFDPQDDLTMGDIDEQTAEFLNGVLEDLGAFKQDDSGASRIVHGTVRFSEGLPASGYRVNAFHRKLRGEDPLGEAATTDDEGAYTIPYVLPRQADEQVRHVNLQIRVYRDGNDEPVSESDVLFNAPGQATIDIDLGTGEPSLSEYDRLLASARLHIGGADFIRLTDEDQAFIAAATGIDAQRVSQLVEGQRLERESIRRIARNPRLRTDPSIPAAAFYAWEQAGLPGQLDVLLETEPSALIDTLQRAIDAHQVPATLSEKIPAILEHLTDLHTERALGLPVRGGSVSARQLLGTLEGDEQLDDEEAAAFATLESRRLPVVEMWTQAAEVVPEPKLHALQDMYLLNTVVSGDEGLLRNSATRLREQAAQEDVSLADAMIAYEVADWADLLRESGSPEADDATLMRRGRELGLRAAGIMPTDFVLSRASRLPDDATLREGISSLTRLRQPDGEAWTLDRSLNELSLEDIPDGERQAVATSFESLQRLVRTHPGLGLEDILREEMSPDQQAAEIAQRIGLMERVYRQNPDVNFLELDYGPDGNSEDAIRFDGLSVDESKKITRTLKAYQRAHMVSGNALRAWEVLEAGFSSAAAITNVDVSIFANRTGLTVGEATAVYADALDQAGTASLAYASIQDVVQAQNFGPTFSVSSEKADSGPAATFRKMDGFEEHFGSQASCRCQHCQSVLSPAAYFVDLMYFINKNVTQPVFESLPKHRMRLESRRPDLWDLALTCENTDTLIPTLEIVVEILEQQVGGTVPEVYRKLATTAGSIHQPFVLPLHRVDMYLKHFELTRADVAKAIGADADTYARARLGLSVTERDLIVQDRSGASDYLEGIFGKGRDSGWNLANGIDVQTVLGATGWTRKELGDLLASHSVGHGAKVSIVAGKRDPLYSIQNDIEKIQGLNSKVVDRLHRFARLWRKVPWTISELDEVLFHLSGGPKAVLSGHYASSGGPLDDLSGQRLQEIATLLDIQERFKLPLQEALALVSTFTPVSFGSRTSLFNRLFNLEPFVTQDGRWPPVREASTEPGEADEISSDSAELLGSITPSTVEETSPPHYEHFTHPTFMEGTSQPNNRVLQRLIAGLQVTDQELVDLLLGLRLVSGQARSVELSPDNLAVLYRHARLARLLGLSVKELAQLMELGDVGTASGRLQDLDDVTGLLAFHDRWQASGLDLDELGYAVGGTVLKPEDYPDASSIASQIADAIRSERPLEFDATVLTQLPNVTESVSRVFVEANEDGAVGADEDGAVGADEDDAVGADEDGAVGADEDDAVGADEDDAVGADEDDAVAANKHQAFERVADSGRWRLAASFDVTDTATHPFNHPAEPAGVAHLEERDGEIRELLVRYDVRSVLATRLAAALNLPDAASVEQVAWVAGVPLFDHDLALTNELQPGQIHQQAPVLLAIIQGLLPLHVLLRRWKWDSKSLEFIADQPGIFGLASEPEPPSGISVASALKVAAYARLISPANTDFTVEEPPADPDAVREVLMHGVAPDPELNAEDQRKRREVLARALRVSPSRLETLYPHLDLSGDDFGAFDRLAAALELATRLGISGETLKQFVPMAAGGARLDAASEFHALTNAAEGMYAVIRARYPDVALFESKMEGFQDRIRSLKRDGLVDYLIHSSGKGIRDTSDLYATYLIDTEMEGCARTSRIVSAISSLQLYVHRIRMNLEQEDPRRVSPGAKAVNVHPQSIPDTWAWRKNYRVWEANRKVFLHPENYLEPTLRDDKTPLFEELEGALLQQEINEQSATDAYARYLRGFVEVANLKIAGAYEDQVDETSRLHLLGVTPSDPPVYYYRTADYARKPNTPVKAGDLVGSTPWQKLDVQIASRVASIVPYQGSLIVFWSETNSRPRSKFVNGSSVTDGYDHSVSLRYSRLNVDGTWTASQLLRLSPAAAPIQDYSYGLGNSSIPSGPSASSTFTVTTREEKGSKSGLMSVYPYIFHSSPASDSSMNLPLNVPDGSILLSTGNFHSAGLLWSRNELSPQPRGSLFSNTGNFYRFSGLHLHQNSIVRASKVLPRNTGRYHQLGNLLHDLDSYLPFPENGLTFSLQDAVINWTTQPDGQPVNGTNMDYVVEVEGIPYLLRETPGTRTFRLYRLRTTVAEKLVSGLMSEGLSCFLATAFQEGLTEEPPPLSDDNHWLDDLTDRPANKRVLPDGSVIRLIDYKSLDGTYFRELFFHIPFLVADYLNSQQRFSAAQRWYHYIFDPASTDIGVNRVWRYREFRSLPRLDPKAVREYLTDPQAIAAYRKDEFNPHAIARLRLSAYQKSIVMKYVDNLLDWGDSLFSQFTMESVNEATMLYIMAADILGERPADVGDCGTGTDDPLTYKKIAPALKEDSQLLIELENVVRGGAGMTLADRLKAMWSSIDTVATDTISLTSLGQDVNDGASNGDGLNLENGVGTPDAVIPASARLSDPMGWRKRSQSYWKETSGTALRQFTPYGDISRNASPESVAPGSGRLDTGGRIVIKQDPRSAGAHTTLPANAIVAEDYVLPGKSTVEPGDASNQDLDFETPDVLKGRRLHPKQAYDVIKNSLVFCFPANSELLAYWDRVENRLFNIRNCMDITGERRQLALFQPEIDPRFLIRAKAAGLSLEDVLGVTAGSVPPYRFTYLIEKAKQYAGTVQSLGTSLLSALEKRDAEEMSRLRTVHEQNMLSLRKQALDWELQAAEATLASLEQQKLGVENRKARLTSRRDTNLIPPEIRQDTIQQQVIKNIEEASTFDHIASMLAMIPQLGAPTALTFGGSELSRTMQNMAARIRDSGSKSQTEGAAAGQTANNERRKEEWDFQIESAVEELDVVLKQIDAATIRKDIAQDAIEVHKHSVEQAEEVYALYRDKFSNFGLYTWLSTQLHRLHRDAFNAALSVARMAEQAYRFERDDDSATLLGGSYWEASQSGLLAGERLLLDLQHLERRFMETNLRSLEVEQSFSLLQCAPDQLLKLQQSGECKFDIPEWMFDLAYPGHYRRRIKGVRVTIPGVTGPLVNVGASLKLTESSIRREPSIDAALIDVPLRHTTAIATSTAQNDAGVFEFSFRDERYMPFEGAGAISSWELLLPKHFRPFDYGTISDVVLRISYTAEGNADLRKKVEGAAADAESSLRSHLANPGIPHLISLRHQFPDAWHRLVHSPVGTEVTLHITERHLPFLIANLIHSQYTLADSAIDVMLQTTAKPDIEIKFGDSILTEPPPPPSPPAEPAPSSAAEPIALAPTEWREVHPGLFKATVPARALMGSHELSIQSVGSFGAGEKAIPATIDTAQLKDIAISFRLQAAREPDPV